MTETVVTHNDEGGERVSLRKTDFCYKSLQMFAVFVPLAQLRDLRTKSWTLHNAYRFTNKKDKPLMSKSGDTNPIYYDFNNNR